MTTTIKQCSSCNKPIEIQSVNADRWVAQLVCTPCRDETARKQHEQNLLAKQIQEENRRKEFLEWKKHFDTLTEDEQMFEYYKLIETYY